MTGPKIALFKRDIVTAQHVPGSLSFLRFSPALSSFSRRATTDEKTPRRSEGRCLDACFGDDLLSPNLLSVQEQPPASQLIPEGVFGAKLK